MIGPLTRSGCYRAAALGCALLLAATGLTGYVRPADAAARSAVRATVPGTPGVPQDPTVVFNEDFENRLTPLPIRLDTYTGATGMTYTADPAWLQNCNGWVAAFSDPGGGSADVAPQVADCTPAPNGPGTPGATAWNRVRQLAQALGIQNGSADPSGNHAVSAYTNGAINNGDPGADKVEFQTARQIPLVAQGRFLTFSVNAAETSCDTNHNHALLNFYLENGTTSTPVTSRSINPCVSGSQVSTGFWAGTFPGDAPLLYTGSSVGIKMTNGQGSGNGNDHAFDDIRLMDVTPQLDKSFSPATADVGGTSTLTFTITNTTDLLEKRGWSFTDTLPSGLRLASPADARTTCPAGTVDAPNGGSTVSIRDGALNAGEASCTVSVKVTSDTAGTYTNDASNITDSTGLNPPGSSDVTFQTPPRASISVKKSATPATYSRPGQAVHYSYLVTNTGSVELDDVHVSDNLAGLPPVRCPQSTLAPGTHQTCTATYHVTQADLDRGSVHNVARAQGATPGSTMPVISGPSAATVRAARHPAIIVHKSVRPKYFSRAGQVLHYRFKVTNTGNVTLGRVHINDSKHGLSKIRCPHTTLAPDRSMTCTATYRITRADLRRGVVKNTAVAQGRPPGATTPVKSKRSVVRAYGNVPVTG